MSEQWQWFWISATTLAVLVPAWLVSRWQRAPMNLRCESCGSNRQFRLVMVKESGFASVKCGDCGQVKTVLLDRLMG